jgi:hypothetical protein
MKKSAKRAAKSSRKPKIQMCVDRILTGAEKIKAMHTAFNENSANRPPPHKPSRRRFGASSMGAPLKMALEAGKKWADGRTLGVFFLDGSATQKAACRSGVKWSKFANSSTSRPARPTRRSAFRSSPTTGHGRTSAPIASASRRPSRR